MFVKTLKSSFYNQGFNMFLKVITVAMVTPAVHTTRNKNFANTAGLVLVWKLRVVFQTSLLGRVGLRNLFCFWFGQKMAPGSWSRNLAECVQHKIRLLTCFTLSSHLVIFNSIHFIPALSKPIYSLTNPSELWISANRRNNPHTINALPIRVTALLHKHFRLFKIK